MKAKKASSQKPRSNIGRWGLGMIQYQNIAKIPVITQTEQNNDGKSTQKILEAFRRSKMRKV